MFRKDIYKNKLFIIYWIRYETFIFSSLFQFMLSAITMILSIAATIINYTTMYVGKTSFNPLNGSKTDKN